MRRRMLSSRGQSRLKAKGWRWCERCSGRLRRPSSGLADFAGLTELRDNFVEFSTGIRFGRLRFRMEKVRIDKRERLVHEYGGVNEQALPHQRAWERIGVILTDAAELGTSAKDLFQPPLVFEEGSGVSLRA